MFAIHLIAQAYSIFCFLCTGAHFDLVFGWQVCCSGHGKNGALCVLQQSIRPELITEVRRSCFLIFSRTSVTNSRAEFCHIVNVLFFISTRTKSLMIGSDCLELLVSALFVTQKVEYLVQNKCLRKYSCT